MDPTSNPAFFDQRRHTEPQAVIDALVEQTTRQGRAIYDLGQEVKQLTGERDKLARVFECLDAVGACCTWHIHYSSEGCEIVIGGVPILLTFPDGNGLHAFLEHDGHVDLVDAIPKVRKQFDKVCNNEQAAEPSNV